MSYNLPGPSLIGLFLIVSTHNGPNFVFHYPPELSDTTLHCAGAEESDEDFDDEDFDYADTTREKESSSLWDANHLDYYLGTKEDIVTFLDARSQANNQKNSRISNKTVWRLEASSNGSQIPPTASSDSNTTKSSSLPPEGVQSKRILGFEPEHLCEMLCPSKNLCNRRFEVILEKVVFLGLPVHILNNGLWSSKALKSKSKSQFSDPQEAAISGDAESKSSMNMFHIVFVMNPPDIERDYRIDEMFYHVTSKISLVLRSEQLKNEYVSNQMRDILRLKEEWRRSTKIPSLSTLSNYLITQSSLCKAMADCYESISRSRIANLMINNKLRSFQIPIKLEFHSLPELSVPFIPGSYLSSAVNRFGKTGLVGVGETTRYGANNFMDSILGKNLADGHDNVDDDDDNIGSEDKSNVNDVIYYSLLLLDDPEIIIRDMKVELHSGLSTFLRQIKPTESLFKVAQRLLDSNFTFSMGEVKLFALHLIYWRKARIIPPLNTRSIYIVSPMAPLMTNLQSDIAKFKRYFPAAPSLPLFLKLLSTRSKKPRQFASIIPSRDHKDTYLMALGWLIRFGYVTQLHTYIWLKVTRKIKMRVEEEMENELGKGNKRNKETEDKEVSAPDNNVNLPVDNSSKKMDTKSSSHGSIDDEIESLQRSFESAGQAPKIILEEDEETILVDPGRASSIERRWINKIIHDECKLSPELTSIFFKVLKYMNGKNSLELLLLKENISRTDLRKLLVEIEDHIISVRHW